MEGFSQSQIAIRYLPSGITLNAVKAYNCEMTDVPLDSMIILDKNERTILYISSFSDRSEKKTNTTYAPWHVLESNDKKYARIKALKIVIDAIEAALDNKTDKK